MKYLHISSGVNMKFEIHNTKREMIYLSTREFYDGTNVAILRQLAIYKASSRWQRCGWRSAQTVK